MRDAAFEEWVEEARGMRIEKALDLAAPAHAISKKTRYVGPCPGCGGVDRFSLNMRKNIFWCRKSAEGGDAIALARHVTGLGFLEAVEMLTGRTPPGRAVSAEEKAARRQRVAEIEQKRAAEAVRLAAEENEFRSREIVRAHKIWKAAGPATYESWACRYLAHRGLFHLPHARLRSASAVPYWHHIDGEWRQIYIGPALVAAIQNNDGRFIGCHVTWIDPALATASGKAAIVHPKTGELLDAKKVRGSQKGGHIMLGAWADPDRSTRLVVGEGIETTLSVATAEQDTLREMGTVYWASVNLHNLGGKSAGSVPHPTLTLTDSRGRTRAQRVPGPVPDLEDKCVLEPPDWASDILLLGDGDSDRLTTRNTLLRFAGRWARPGRVIRAAWADEGSDFNDMLRGAT